MAQFTININEYICPGISISLGNSGPCFVEILAPIVEGLSNYKLYANSTLVNITPTVVGNNYKYTFTSLSVPTYSFKIITTCTARNMTMSSQSISFVPNQLPNTTDVYAFFDQTSMQLVDAQDASIALRGWFDQYKLDNPDYEGNLYIIGTNYENYVIYPRAIYEGDANGYTTGGWGEIQILPPNWNTSNWAPPTDLLLLGFVDEANSSYHYNRVSNGFGVIVQPTDTYKNDFYGFKNIYYNQYSFFRGVIYPIVRDVAGQGGALILQLAAAMKCRKYTQAEINALNTSVDVSLLLTQNPYENATTQNGQTLEPLENYNWIGVYDKTSPASAVFNSSTFADELNDIITQNNQTCP